MGFFNNIFLTKWFMFLEEFIKKIFDLYPRQSLFQQT